MYMSIVFKLPLAAWQDRVQGRGCERRRRRRRRQRRDRGYEEDRPHQQGQVRWCEATPVQRVYPSKKIDKIGKKESTFAAILLHHRRVGCDVSLGPAHLFHAAGGFGEVPPSGQSAVPLLQGTQPVLLLRWDQDEQVTWPVQAAFVLGFKVFIKVSLSICHVNCGMLYRIN